MREFLGLTGEIAPGMNLTGKPMVGELLDSTSLIIMPPLQSVFASQMAARLFRSRFSWMGF